jgi:hypothetical protein
MTYVNLIGTDVIIVNSPSVLSALFEGKSANYSHRPSLTFAELAGWDRLMALMNPGPELNRQRRLMAQTIGSKAIISQMQPMLDEQVLLFMLSIINRPQDVKNSTRT